MRIISWFPLVDYFYSARLGCAYNFPTIISKKHIIVILSTIIIDWVFVVYARSIRIQTVAITSIRNNVAKVDLRVQTVRSLLYDVIELSSNIDFSVYSLRD